LLPGQTAEVNEALETTGQLLAEAIRETRRVSHELVPVLLHDFGLETAVDEFCKRFTGTGLRLTYRVENLAGRLDPHLEVALYRISQELILNVVKHAGADQASLLLEKRAGEIMLEVNDNGKGLRPDNVLPKGMGLCTIRDRVKLLNGTLELPAAPAACGRPSASRCRKRGKINIVRLNGSFK
jgi:signal transduction histidine kinase